MGKRSTERITKTVVDKLQPGEQVWDRDVKGFGARRQRGRPHFFFAYRLGGRRRFISLGEFGQGFTVEQARTEAEKLRGAVSSGKDPARRFATTRSVLARSKSCVLDTLMSTPLAKTSLRR